MQLRKHLPTVLIAMVVAALTAGGPAIAHGVHAAFAHNADKVDGKHAVGSGASLASAGGKLVAHNQAGKLPKKFIPKVDAARNADRLNGKHSSELGINGYERVFVQSAFNSTAHKVVNAACPAGKRLLSGGASVFPSLADPARDAAPIVIRWSRPAAGLETWSGGADETAAYGFEWHFTVYAICAI